MQARREAAVARLAAAGGVEDGAIREGPDVMQQHEVAALSWVRACPRCELLQLEVGAGGSDAPCERRCSSR